MNHYTAHITPEAWERDNAVPVEPEGPDRWDCTRAVARAADYFAKLAGEHGWDDPGGLLDRDDRLKDDPDAPMWVGEWSGPFTIRVHRSCAGDAPDVRDVLGADYDPAAALRECRDLWGSGAWRDDNATEDLCEVMGHVERLLARLDEAANAARVVSAAT